jgi:NAD(P)-dependent dehydrogenase (short-subunit alcohol dehydrogenase family)
MARDLLKEIRADLLPTHVIGFTRNLAHEVAPHGIYVLGVCPGIMLHETLKAICAIPTATPAPGRA